MHHDGFQAADHADPEDNDPETPARIGDYSLSGRIDPGSLGHTFPAFDRRFPRREVRLRIEPHYARTAPGGSLVRAEAAAIAPAFQRAARGFPDAEPSSSERRYVRSNGTSAPRW